MSTVRRLIVIRHAKSDYPAGVHDHDRPLNDRGRRDAPEIGRWLERNVHLAEGESPRVLISSAKRAQSTWRLAAAELRGRWDGRDERTEPRIYEASTAELIAIIDECPDSVTTAILVGHNPGLASLVHRLCIEDALRDEATSKFPTSAVAVLETTEAWSVATTMDDAFHVRQFTVPRGRMPG